MSAPPFFRWVIADTHFTTYDQIQAWNTAVSPEDPVLHLGDLVVGGCDVEVARAIWNDLHGQKYLIIGNHDLPWIRGQRIHMHQRLTFRVGAHRILAIHDPTRKTKAGILRYPHFVFSGHIHGSRTVVLPWTSRWPKIINFCPEFVGPAPLSMDAAIRHATEERKNHLCYQRQLTSSGCLPVPSPIET